MIQSVYLNGVTIYNKSNLVRKQGRIALEIEMVEKLMKLGYTKFNGINLNKHLKWCESKYEELTKQIKALFAPHNK
jgi:hypothetical protein